MNFDKLILPPVTVAGLYKKSLIEGTIKKSTSAKRVTNDNPSGYSFLGKNKNHVCILVNLAGEEIIPPVHKQFVTRLLTSCRMNADDVAILNYGNDAIEIKKLKQQLNPAHIVLFGVTPAEIGLPVNIPIFKPQSYDSITYLFIPSISQLNQDGEEGKLLKSKLWVCLKHVFQV